MYRIICHLSNSRLLIVLYLLSWSLLSVNCLNWLSGEEIAEATEREVWEETGVHCRFEKVLCFRHQHAYKFGCSDFYFVSVCRPITEEIVKGANEIALCKWMDVSTCTGRYNVHIICHDVLMVPPPPSPFIKLSNPSIAVRDRIRTGRYWRQELSGWVTATQAQKAEVSATFSSKPLTNSDVMHRVASIIIARVFLHLRYLRAHLLGHNKHRHATDVKKRVI